MVDFDEGLPNPFQALGIKCLKFLQNIVPASKQLNIKLDFFKDLGNP